MVEACRVRSKTVPPPKLLMSRILRKISSRWQSKRRTRETHSSLLKCKITRVSSCLWGEKEVNRVSLLLTTNRSANRSTHSPQPGCNSLVGEQARLRAWTLLSSSHLSSNPGRRHKTRVQKHSKTTFRGLRLSSPR